MAEWKQVTERLKAACGLKVEAGWDGQSSLLLEREKRRPKAPEEEKELWVEAGKVGCSHQRDQEKWRSYLVQTSYLEKVEWGNRKNRGKAWSKGKRKLEYRETLSISLIADGSHKGPRQYWDLECCWAVFSIDYLGGTEAKF